MSRSGGGGSFLEASSIHGLYYLSTTRGLARLLWLLCVAISLSLAAAIIVVTVLGWESNPTVIANVENVPVKVDHKRS